MYHKTFKQIVSLILIAQIYFIIILSIHILKHITYHKLKTKKINIINNIQLCIIQNIFILYNSEYIYHRKYIKYSDMLTRYIKLTC